MPEYTFFFGEESPFSQWHPSAFTVAGNNAVAAELFTFDHPRAHKALGRKVKGFDDHVWRRERENIVMAGNRAKFTQNPTLLGALLATRGTELVEASPFDKIWGIGLSAVDTRAKDPKQWKGQNLLGKILTKLRDELAA